MLQEEVEAVRRGGGAKAERAAAEQVMGVAALWLGEASPAAELVPVNPIHWSLTRQPPAPRPASNAFGGGYFVNAESIPGSPELHSTPPPLTALGTFRLEPCVTLTKRYTLFVSKTN